MNHLSDVLKSLVTAACGGLLVLLSGCGGDDHHAHDHDHEAPEITQASVAEANTVANYLQLLPAEPTESIQLSELPDQAGTEITVQARIGGRLNPFVSGMAAMVVADRHQIKACDDIPGDTCITPWDYCCVPPEDIASNTAMVQVVDDNGAPLAAELPGVHDIRPGSFVTIKGTIQQAKPSPIIIANAIFVDNK